MSLNISQADCAKNIKLIYDLQEKYHLHNEDFKNIVTHLSDFRVITPVVGKFSTGKSSLINAVLGKNQFNKFYLGVDLTPETSVPAEITYGREDRISVVDKDAHETEISLSEYLDGNFSADKISKIQLVIDNPFLKSISTVKIVDMPGFDSGIELHNRAIDDYLPESHAYILTFAATEPVIPESIANFLRELKIYRMPVYIVITKSGSVTESQLKECVENIRRNAMDYLGLKDIEICCTNAKGRRLELEPFMRLLRKIESESRNIFVESINRTTQIEAERLIKYLRAVIRRVELIPSELESEKEGCRRNLNDMKARLERTQREFSAQLDNCINNIQSKVTESLYNAAAELELALLNNSDINSRINAIVRETVLSSMQTEFAPRFRQYVENMNRHIHFESGVDSNFKFDDKNFAMEAAVQTAVSSSVKKIIPAVLKALGISVGGPIAAVVTLVASLFFKSKLEETRRADQRIQARRKIHNEIIPQVASQVSESLRKSICTQIEIVNNKLAEESQRQIQDQEKVLAELTNSLKIEKALRDENLKSMNADLNVVSSILRLN